MSIKEKNNNGKRIIRVLILEDTKEIIKELILSFRESSIFNFDVYGVTNLKSLSHLLNKKIKFDISIIDYNVNIDNKTSRKAQALGIISVISTKDENPFGRIYVYTGKQDDLAHCVSAMKAGASDFISKGILSPTELVEKIEYDLQKKELSVIQIKDMENIILPNLNKKLNRYVGQWVALKGNIIEAHGKNKIEVFLNILEKNRNITEMDIENQYYFIFIN